jgi:hypothetical protein
MAFAAYNHPLRSNTIFERAMHRIGASQEMPMSQSGHSEPIQFVLKHLYDRKPLKADMVSRPQGQGACSSSR